MKSPLLKVVTPSDYSVIIIQCELYITANMVLEQLTKQLCNRIKHNLIIFYNKLI